MSWRVVAHMNRQQSSEQFHSVPIKVLLAESQVVAGTNYNLEVLVGKSKCKKKVRIDGFWV
jgi:hypothetical protein